MITRLITNLTDACRGRIATIEVCSIKLGVFGV